MWLSCTLLYNRQQLSHAIPTVNLLCGTSEAGSQLLNKLQYYFVCVPASLQRPLLFQKRALQNATCCVQCCIERCISTVHGSCLARLVFVYIAGQHVYVYTWQIHKASGLREIPYSELYSQQYVVFVDRHGCISIALAEPRVLSEK